MTRTWMKALPAGVMALTFSLASTEPAFAWSWPWQKNSTVQSAPSTPTPAVAAPAAPQAKPAVSPTAAAPAPQTSKTALKSDSDKVLGTVSQIDAADQRLSLKTSSGKTETFTLSKSSEIVEHHKVLALSALKPGERVSVHYAPGTTAASRVYVLEGKKA